MATQGHETEGVIKFQLEYRQAAAVQSAGLTELIAWRAILHRLGLVGQHPNRYMGYGFGNVSVRLPDGGFLISGTQTGAPEWLGPDGYCQVLGMDAAANSIIAEGPTKPSSESLTHGAVYALNPDIAAVLHVHSPEIWRASASLGLPAIAAEVAYGTPEMARAVAALHREHGWEEQGLFTMMGHEDGVIAFGPDLDTAGAALTVTLAAALSAAR